MTFNNNNNHNHNNNNNEIYSIYIGVLNLKEQTIKSFIFIKKNEPRKRPKWKNHQIHAVLHKLHQKKCNPPQSTSIIASRSSSCQANLC